MPVIPLSAASIRRYTIPIGFTCLLWLTFFCPIGAQSSISDIQKQADLFYQQADFRTALRYYTQAGQEHAKDKAVRLRVAICMYETNEVDGALQILRALMKEDKTEADVFFYTAKCYEAKNLFGEAIAMYKSFLQRTKKEDPRRDWVKDQLFRDANGQRLKHADEQTYVENAGTTMNTTFREFGVKNSPRTLDKIYFNSDRDDVSIHKAANGNVDIYASQFINGKWAVPMPLPAHINTAGYEEVCGFSANGQILYYLADQAPPFRIRTDTFTTQPDKSLKGYFKSPVPPNTTATDLVFFNDTICLYASDAPGGYGGFDLYISFLKNESWSKGINLGPVINSFYDERYPFLTRNGLTLFFSSNNLLSIGGYDIFSSAFDPGMKRWSMPENLGFPVNSSGNETYMVMSPDGMTAYLTSDRKSGFGSDDIYRIFFKQPLQAHQEISVVPTFQQFIAAQDAPLLPQDIPVKPADIKEYYISHLYFENVTDILTPQNTKKLDLLVNLMLIYPKIRVELNCFELPSGQRTYSVYYSIKKAEEAAAYLKNRGIPADRILLKGYGSSYPIASLPAGLSTHPLYVRLNQRLEIALHGYKTEPVIIHMENIQVPENMQDERGFRFNALRHGFYYSIQFASVTQILQHPNLESFEGLCIETDPVKGQYLYLAGMLTTFANAEERLKEIKDAGFPEAKIIPYVDGIRIQSSEVSALAKTYPDLVFYMDSLPK